MIRHSENYLRYISSVRRYSQRTVEIYRSVLCGFFEFAQAGTADAALSPEMLRNYEVHLMDTLGENPRTVSLHMSVLSGFCRYLVREGVLSSNPVRLVKRPKQERRLPEFYRDSSMQKYFDSHCGTLEYGNPASRLDYMIISILYGTGLRRAELISLNRSSFDGKRAVIRVRGKGDKMREIPLTPSLCKEISLYLQLQDENEKCSSAADSPLLQTLKGGRMYPVFVDRAVKRELGGVGDISGRKSPHVLRHSLATALLDEGADLNSIKELLGHSSLAATQVYTHNSIERLKKVYQSAHPRAKNGGKNGN